MGDRSEELILHRIALEELLWSVEDQNYYSMFWHTDDCLACALFGMPIKDIEFYEKLSSEA